MTKISDELDFSIDDTESRLELVTKLVGGYDDGVEGIYDDYLMDFYEENYNPHINQTGFLSENTKVGKDLEALADYLLYSKDNNNSDDIVTDYKKKRNNIRESSIDKLMKVTDFRKETNKSIIKVPKIKVTKKDRKRFKDLQQTGEAIENLSKMIQSGRDSEGKDISVREIKKLKWIRTDIQKDEIAIKTDLMKYVSFNGGTKHEKDHSTLSYIRFGDVEIIRILIEEYVKLKEGSFDDTFGYMKVILFTFEELVDATDFEDYMRDILIWKIEGVPYDDMIEMLKDKYNMKITKPRLSKTTRDIIPNMIIETYKQSKEDWVFTYMIKGDYQTCSNCKGNYLKMTKYFSPDRKSKTGLRYVCRECRKREYENRENKKNTEEIECNSLA